MLQSPPAPAAGAPAGGARRLLALAARPWPLRLGFLLVLLGLWAAASALSRPWQLPLPSDVARALARLLTSPHLGLLGAVVHTAAVLAIGLLAASAAGLASGWVAGGRPAPPRRAENALSAFWPAPAVALLPLLVDVTGLTARTEVVVVALSGFLPMHLGVAAARSTAAGGGRLARLARRQLLGGLLGTFRAALGRALVGIVVAEMFLSSSGLGGKMSQFAGEFSMADYYASLVVLVAFGLVLISVVSRLERRVSRAGAAQAAPAGSGAAAPEPPR